MPAWAPEAEAGPGEGAEGDRRKRARWTFLCALATLWTCTGIPVKQVFHISVMLTSGHELQRSKNSL